MFNKTRLEYEYIDKDGVQYYSLMEKLVLSHMKYDIIIPRNSVTRYTEYHEIVYDYLINQRTITPLQASWRYLYAMKCNGIPFRARLFKYLYSLRNLW